ncbi:MAG: hypothetical protein F6K50_09710 [Moorea sp. SIO3I7]|nr:hypothetical protein [Moorena sp. SIO3I7]
MIKSCLFPVACCLYLRDFVHNLNTNATALEVKIKKYGGLHNYQVDRIVFPLPTSLLSLPCSLFPVPCSLKSRNLYLTELQTAVFVFPTPYSLLPTPYSLLPTPFSNTLLTNQFFPTDK